jgi:hypothetical protein
MGVRVTWVAEEALQMLISMVYNSILVKRICVTLRQAKHTK